MKLKWPEWIRSFFAGRTDASGPPEPGFDQVDHVVHRLDLFMMGKEALPAAPLYGPSTVGRHRYPGIPGLCRHQPPEKDEFQRISQQVPYPAL